MEESRPTRVASSRPVHSEVLREPEGTSVGSENQNSSVLNDILQVISRQDKRISEQEQTISELTKVVKELTVQRPRSKEKSQPDIKPVIMDENGMSEPDFVVVEEVMQPSVRVAANSRMVSEAPVTSELGGDSSEGIQVRESADTGRDSAEYDGVVLRATDEHDQSQELETGDMRNTDFREVPVPAVRRSKRSTAGVHTNPFHAPRSACHAVSVSTDMVSQVLTSIGTALFEKALQGAMNAEICD
ncbi:hypothetical protein DPX16_18873 [Anabarilius grahami]|uniref:Uncharacterized protein n=1 Tax=Anabarilius grahami TaxID=495550 RepID=A0A3N0YLJ6_ANAGA|nr:hypothetical protein DPX16_18873 [Anabarilius grahami]